MTPQIKKVAKENWGFILFMLLMFASRSSFADWYYVPSGSMLPTIVEGDRIFVDKMAYRLEVPFTGIEIMQTGTPERGDIVVFVSKKADTRLVKRLIGVPGDKISMHNNRLRINGEWLDYQPAESSDYLATESLDEVNHFVKLIPIEGAADSFSQVTVPEGHYLVLGDNRNNSVDSRYYGFVPAAEIQGKATKVIVSLNPDNYYLPRTERNLIPLI